MVDASNWEEWYPWQRVLTAWKVKFGRFGMTVHSLAAVTETPLKTVLKQLRNPQNGAGGSWCSMIGSPVWVMRWGRVNHWDAEMGGLTPTGWKIQNTHYWWKEGVHGEEAKKAAFLGAVMKTVDMYPDAPGIRRMKPLKRVGLPYHIRQLREAAAGDMENVLK